jgi:hypothetical protein
MSFCKELQTTEEVENTCALSFLFLLFFLKSRPVFIDIYIYIYGISDEFINQGTLSEEKNKGRTG